MYMFGSLTKNADGQRILIFFPLKENEAQIWLDMSAAIHQSQGGILKQLSMKATEGLFPCPGASKFCKGHGPLHRGFLRMAVGILMPEMPTTYYFMP